MDDYLNVLRLYFRLLKCDVYVNNYDKIIVANNPLDGHKYIVRFHNCDKLYAMCCLLDSIRKNNIGEKLYQTYKLNIDRDLNAARNIYTAGTAGIQARRVGGKPHPFRVW